MQQVIDTSTHLTVPLPPYQYTSTIELFDNQFVILYKNLAKANFPTAISIPKDTKGTISSILSKHLIPICSNNFSSIISYRPKCSYAYNFYQAFKMYIKNNYNDPICNINDPHKDTPKSTIFVYINKDSLSKVSNIDIAYSTLLPLFKHLNKTYFNQDINKHDNPNLFVSLPPIIPVFESNFYDYLENFSFSFSLSSDNEKECITTKVNITDNLFSITCHNLRLDKMTSITKPDLYYTPNKTHNTYIKYDSIADILDKLNNNNIYTPTDCLSIESGKSFYAKDSTTANRIIRQNLHNSSSSLSKTLSIKQTKLIGDLEVVSVEFPRVVCTISSTTAFNRLLNTVFVDNKEVNSQIKCKSFTKLTSPQKYTSVLDRFNVLYAYCYDSIKANLDRIGLTTRVLKANNGITQSYPLVETSKVNNQESSFMNLNKIKRDLLQDLIKKLCSLRLSADQKSMEPGKLTELDSRDSLSFLNLLNKQGNINFETILYDSNGKRKLSSDYFLLNNAYGIFQKYLTNILPSLNFTCVHKDFQYQWLATKIITLYLYHLYIYAHTAIGPYCSDQPDLKLVNHPDYPKVSPSTISSITPVKHLLATLNEEFPICCYFFYVPRSIALDIASSVPLDMINSYNFPSAIVDTPSNTTSATNTNVTITPETVSLDDATKELNNVSNTLSTNDIVKNTLDPFEILLQDMQDIQNNLNKSLLDNEDSSNISDKQ